MLRATQFGMSQDHLKVEEYYRAQKSGFVRVLALCIRQTVMPELGQQQSLTLELSPDNMSESIELSFFPVRQLRLEDLHPGSTCYLSIESMAAAQWEGVRYRVHSMEQDFTLNFYCADFEIKRRSITSASALI